MTKREMVYEIISNTRLFKNGLNEYELNKDINKISKNRIENVYNEFLKDKDNAYFYYSILFI